MKIIGRFQNQFILRFEKGEEFLPALIAFLKREKIRSGFFYGLGALKDPAIAYYNPRTKKYQPKKFFGEHFEVTGLSGDAAEKDSQTVIHCHLVFGDKKFHAFTGHLISGTVGGTLEIHFFKTPPLKRKFDPETGLNLLR